MEKYSGLVFLHLSMFLIPFVCAFGTTKNDQSDNSTLASLLSQRNDTLMGQLVEDPNFGLSDVYSSNMGGSASNFEIISSKPIIEKIPEGSSMYLNLRRDAPDRGFSEETKVRLLDLHNMYRGNVTPYAGDMAFMEWDTKLEQLAQLWADGCSFAHGRPPNTSYPGLYGQNLYFGTDSSGLNGLWLWYDEYNYYNLTSQVCDPGEQCGHYVTMAWAASFKLGCGIKRCGLRHLMVCHYFPAAMKGTQMYTIAKPCSQCMDEGGSLCINNLCMTWDQCERNPTLCAEAKCNLKCHNCGRLDKEKCRCECADGYDSPDCSRLCVDEHKRCGVNPGFPNKASCSISNFAVAKKYCRKMCQTCNPYEKDTKIRHTCCEGKFCDYGYVLDLERKLCRCRLLCPGPLCDILEGIGAPLKHDLMLVVLTVTVSSLYIVKFYFLLFQPK